MGTTQMCHITQWACLPGICPVLVAQAFNSLKITSSVANKVIQNSVYLSASICQAVLNDKSGGHRQHVQWWGHGFNRTEIFLLSGVIMDIREQSSMVSHLVAQHLWPNALTACHDVMLWYTTMMSCCEVQPCCNALMECPHHIEGCDVVT